MATSTKPDDKPRWATSDVTDPTTGQQNTASPPSAIRDSGWTPSGVKPNRQYTNWLGRYIYRWIDFLDVFKDAMAQHWQGADSTDHIPDGAIRLNKTSGRFEEWDAGTSGWVELANPAQFVLHQNFPNVNAPVTATDEELNTLDGITATASQLNKTTFLDNITGEVTASHVELNQLDGITLGSAAQQTYSTATVGPSGDFTSGQIKCARVGNLVTISFDSMGHASATTASTTIEAIPSEFRPSFTRNNIYVMTGSYVAQVTVSFNGTLTIAYRDWAGAVSAQALTGAGVISYVI